MNWDNIINDDISNNIFVDSIRKINNKVEQKFKTNKNKRYKYFLLQKVEKYQRQKICIQKI